MLAKLRLVSVLAVLTACDRSAANRLDANARAATADSVVLERMACFGTCPTYRLSVARSGRVAFLSLDPGDEGRTEADSIAPATAARLLADAAEAGIYALPDSIATDPRLCPTSATDFASYVVTIADPNGRKSVVDYAGCFQHMGASSADWSLSPSLAPLRAYENAIDSIAGSARWVRPRNAERPRPNAR